MKINGTNGIKSCDKLINNNIPCKYFIYLNSKQHFPPNIHHTYFQKVKE